jgi:hypothetical protein
MTDEALNLRTQDVIMSYAMSAIGRLEGAVIDK